MAQSNQSNTALKRSAFSVANVLQRPDIKLDDDGGVAFRLDENIYTLLLLLYTRQSDNDEGCHSFINKRKLRKLKFLALSSYLVQMTGIMYFLCNWYSTFWATEVDTLWIHDCEVPSGNMNQWGIDIDFDDVNTTMIGNQQCTFSKIRATHWQTLEAQNVAAKFIAVYMAFVFLTSDILSVPRLITVSKITKTKLKYLWMMLTVSQLILVFTMLVRVTVLIFSTDNALDILTVGISFIILTEIDDKVYTAVKDLNLFGDELFYVKVNNDELLQTHDTIYNYISVEDHDCIVLAGTFIVALVMCIAFGILSTLFGTSFGSWAWFIFIPIPAIFVLFPAVLLPTFPCLCSYCKCFTIKTN
eukprot:391815_1